jgi:hypothetical protein
LRAVASQVNQAGLGFRGQSQNAAIVNFLTTGRGGPAVYRVLNSEISTRKIEFATLVGPDRVGEAASRVLRAAPCSTLLWWGSTHLCQAGPSEHTHYIKRKVRVTVEPTS